MNRYAWRALPVVLLLLIASAGISVRADADSDIPGFIRFTGKVSQVAGSHFIVSSRKVDLMNITHEGKRYQTKILDVNGKPIEPSAIRKGDVMLVWGQEQPDGSIIANSIHLQQRE
jgi:hypothetical protein